MSKSRRQSEQKRRRYRMANYSGLYRRYFNVLHTKDGEFHTSKCGTEIPVIFTCLKEGNNKECTCSDCMYTLPYVVENNGEILVCSKKKYLEFSRYKDTKILYRIRAFNSFLKKYGNKLPYYEQSFLDARYSSIRCIIDDNDIVTYYCLLNNMDTPTKFRPTFIPIDHRYIPEYIKKVLYLKCLQDNAVVTLASCFKKKNQN